MCLCASDPPSSVLVPTFFTGMISSDISIECPLKPKHPCEGRSKCFQYDWHLVDGPVSNHVRVPLFEREDFNHARNLTGFGKRQYMKGHQLSSGNFENQVYNADDWNQALGLSHCTMTNVNLQEANSSFATARANVSVHLFECAWPAGDFPFMFLIGECVENFVKN